MSDIELTEEEQARGWAIRTFEPVLEDEEDDGYEGEAMTVLYNDGYMHCYLPANLDQLRNLSAVIDEYVKGVRSK